MRLTHDGIPLKSMDVPEVEACSFPRLGTIASIGASSTVLGTAVHVPAVVCVSIVRPTQINGTLERAVAEYMTVELSAAPAPPSAVVVTMPLEPKYVVDAANSSVPTLSIRYQ